VLYDDVLIKRVGNLTKRILGVAEEKAAKQPLLYGDINGRPLSFRDFTLLPFRRVVYYVAKTAYENAMASERPHACAKASCPNAEAWSACLEAVREHSVDFASSSVATA
jgi:hypothetical protein